MLEMEAFFGPFGPPKLILVDAESVFVGIFRQILQSLGILVEQVFQENHKAIRNERFHQYLNKVEKIHTFNKASLHQWSLGTKFAAYRWNTVPVDGTDI